MIFLPVVDFGGSLCGCFWCKSLQESVMLSKACGLLAKKKNSRAIFLVLRNDGEGNSH